MAAKEEANRLEVSLNKQTSLFCIIIGFGKMGRLVSSQLTKLNIDWISVDTKTGSSASYANIKATPSHVIDKVTHVFICVPTQAHRAVLEEVLSIFPNSQIMLEKPVCSPKDFHWFQQNMHKNVFRRIWINNHYVECSNIHRLRKILHSRNKKKCIEIGFYKNRASDNIAGRFVDNDYLVWGYEGFHMLTIAAMLLPTEEASKYLDTRGHSSYRHEALSDISWAFEEFALESGDKILLKTSTNGRDMTDMNMPKLYSGLQRARKVFVSISDEQETYELEFGHDPFEHTQPGPCYSISGSTINTVMSEENPLLIHIEKFLKSSLDEYSSLEFGIQVTKRLMRMAECTYRFGENKN